MIGKRLKNSRIKNIDALPRKVARIDAERGFKRRKKSGFVGIGIIFGYLMVIRVR